MQTKWGPTPKNIALLYCYWSKQFTEYLKGAMCKMLLVCRSGHHQPIAHNNYNPFFLKQIFTLASVVQSVFIHPKHLMYSVLKIKCTFMKWSPVDLESSQIFHSSLKLSSQPDAFALIHVINSSTRVFLLTFSLNTPLDLPK